MEDKAVKYFEVTGTLRVDSVTGEVIACIRETPEIVKSFESLPNVQITKYSTFSHLEASKSVVFISRWDKPRCERCGDVKPKESSCGCFDNGCE